MCTKWMLHAEILIGHFREMVGNWLWPAVILHSAAGDDSRENYLVIQAARDTGTVQ